MADGVPPLLHPPAAVPAPALATADVSSAPQSSTLAWGIYLDGVIALEPDSVVSIEYKNDSRVSQYPQEAGAFQSYNKVATPFDIRLRMTKSGSASDRGAFLEKVKAAQVSLQVYDVVTPEATYSSVNIVQIAHRHTAQNGATLLTVDLWLLEIRQTATTQFTDSATSKPITSPAKPSGADPKHVGIVQTQPPTAAETKAVQDALAMNPLFTSPESIPGL